MGSNDNQILGVVLIVRHGDRQGFYQNPTTYTATATQITPLGNQQEYQLGELLRSIYVNASSPSYIPGMSTGLFNQSQVYIRADLGGESGVVYDSCVSLTQGMWPVTIDNNITLANGSTIVAPLGGYQNVPIDAVDPNLDVSLEGFLDCNTFDTHTTDFYNSQLFQQMTKQSAAFLKLLLPYVDGRTVSLQNMWNIYDYMNVNSIHNATFSTALPSTFLEQARALANWHEYNVFTDASVSGIGNIAGQAIVPSILDAFDNIVNTTNPVKMMISAIAYKPFISLFNMTGVAAANPQLAGIVDYASVVAFEVRQSSAGGEPMIRFNFKNGTQDFATYDFLNQTGDVPLSVFIDAVAPNAVNTTAAWCNVCQNSQHRGCGALALAAQQARSAALSPIDPVGAGFLGAGLTLAVVLLSFATLAFLGLLSFGRKPKRRYMLGDDEVELRKSPSRVD
ncbi:histidine phosphatase superfamily [Boletus edulis BED1]|uniref:Histidine phosphatase superfamily n=1 Tax=Boletus edulis BED1 TaxID=1328754 RepID=A0AAD4GGA0_BOLED|nr:histidine phosphatase superfamily [Boletus edulis BED1]